jgi:hypothetical protein
LHEQGFGTGLERKGRHKKKKKKKEKEKAKKQKSKVHEMSKTITVAELKKRLEKVKKLGFTALPKKAAV